MLYTLTYVKNEDKVSAKGRPYIALSVKVEGDTRFHNGLGNSQTKNWKVGDQVELELYQEEWKGKLQDKLRVPKFQSHPQKQELDEFTDFRLRELERKVEELEKRLPELS